MRSWIYNGDRYIDLVECLVLIKGIWFSFKSKCLLLDVVMILLKLKLYCRWLIEI